MVDVWIRIWPLDNITIRNGQNYVLGLCRHKMSHISLEEEGTNVENPDLKELIKTLQFYIDSIGQQRGIPP